MKHSFWALSKYFNLYRETGFERSGLFQLIRSEFGNLKTIYPASSVHVTPSFHFSRVLYIDNSKVSKRFFQDSKAVTRLVENEKSYKQKASINFVHADFHLEVGGYGNDFELLISLFGGSLIDRFINCVGKGGLILTCDTFSDLAFFQKHQFKLVCNIICRKGRYIVSHHKPDSQKKKTPSMKCDGKQLKFTDNCTYYLYEK